MILGKGEYMQSSTYFPEGLCLSQGAVVTVKDFSAFFGYEAIQELGS